MSAIQYLRESARNLFVEVPQGAFGTAICIVSTVFGVVATAASLATAGKFDIINKLATRTTNLSGLIVEIPTGCVLRVLNPKYQIDSNRIRSGVFATAISNKVFEAARILSAQPNPVTSRLVSRVTYLVGAVLSVATRVADFAMGVIAGVAALITFAQVDRLNTFALRHLESTAVIADVCKGLRGFVNPFQFPVNQGARL